MTDGEMTNDQCADKRSADLEELTEEQKDRAVIRSLLPRLWLGPEKAGALRWEEIAAEW